MTESNKYGRSILFADWCARRNLSHDEGMQLVEEGRIVSYVVLGRRYVTESADQAFIEAIEAESADSDTAPPSEDIPDILRRRGAEILHSLNRPRVNVPILDTSDCRFGPKP